MLRGPNHVLTYGKTPPQATLMQELLVRTMQGVITSPHTLTIPAEPPIRPIPPKPLYFVDVISPIISITPAEPSDTSFQFTPPDHNVRERESWPQNQQGKSNGPHHMPDIRNLAMISIPSNMNGAPSEARVGTTLVLLSQPSDSAHCGLIAPKQATDLSIMPNNYEC